jgi:hypothetical protein
MTTLPTEAQKRKCYDNTRISDYKTCPRYFFIRHELGWRPAGTGIALIFGLSWHDGQDIVWGQAKNYSQGDLAELAHLSFVATWQEQGLPADIPLEQQSYYAPRTPEIAREMYYNYISKRWRMLQECEVFAIEQPFAVPIPESDHWYIGRLDKGVRYNAQKLVLEHKSTTAYSIEKSFRPDYVDSWYMSAQVKGYQFGATLFFGDLDGVWVDAALVHKKVHDAFKFIPVAHSYTLLKEWLDGTISWIAQIAAEQDAFRAAGELAPGMFKKNEESCYGKYGACPFIDICRSIADPSKLTEPPPGFVHEVWEPFDILGLNKIVEENNHVG